MQHINEFTTWVLRIAIVAIFVISWAGMVVVFGVVVINVFNIPGFRFADKDIANLVVYSLLGSFVTTYILVESEKRSAAAAKSAKKGAKNDTKNISADSSRSNRD